MHACKSCMHLYFSGSSAVHIPTEQSGGHFDRYPISRAGWSADTRRVAEISAVGHRDHNQLPRSRCKVSLSLFYLDSPLTPSRMLMAEIKDLTD